MADLRDSNAQQKYRGSSRSQNKDSQHVAHKYSLELVAHVQSRTPGPQAASLRSSVNAPSNFRMVSVSTNQSDHRQIDRSLMAKATSGETLTKREETRARQQVASVQSSASIPSGHYAAAQEFYKSLETQDGSTLWDARSNRRG